MIAIGFECARFRAMIDVKVCGKGIESNIEKYRVDAGNAVVWSE